MPGLARSEWYDLTRDMNWTLSYVDQEDAWPQDLSNTYGIPAESWWVWDEPYKVTYSEYVHNQVGKDAGVYSVNSVIGRSRMFDELDPGWKSAIIAHYGAIAVPEYIAGIGESRMGRFGRAAAWRNMATFGCLDETRHGQIQTYFPYTLLGKEPRMDWAHKALHTNEWGAIAARHLFDDMFLAADAIDLAIQLNFVFETGFTNLQFMAMAAMADRAHHHLFEKMVASIQTDEARHSQIGHPVMRTLLENGSRERAQYLIDKMWWRCWRLFLALSGTAMEYLAPVSARTRSFKEFMTEWVTEQFMKNLAEFDLEKPWFWDLFVEELDYAHHSLQLGLYTYRTTLWFDVAMPDRAERDWLNEKYPQWNETYGALWEELERRWEAGGEAGTARTNAVPPCLTMFPRSCS